MQYQYVDKFIPSDSPLNPSSEIVLKTKEIISQAWRMSKTIHHNPSPNPISLEKRHLALLEQHLTEFVVTEKSDGVRYQLVLGMNNGQGFAVMVNRRMQMYEVPIYANPDYFKGSVFDGELVLDTSGVQLVDHKATKSFSTQNDSNTVAIPNNNNKIVHRQFYLVFDSICVKGESRVSNTFMNRYHEYTSIFDLDGKDLFQTDVQKWDEVAFEMAQTKDKIVCLGNRMALQFKPKPFVTFINVGSLWRSIHNLGHKSDGLIVQRTTTGIGTGTDPSILKWKQNHTIDLIIEGKYIKGSWAFQIFFQDNEKLVSSTERKFSIKNNNNVDNIFRIDLKLNQTLNSTADFFGESHKNSFKLLGEFNCEIDENKFIVWCLLERWRKDKYSANNYQVIQQILQNANDNVSIKDLVNLTSQHIYKM
jgi:hypothetical protein